MATGFFRAPERKVWDPDPNSWVFAVYRWYYRQPSHAQPYPENFCHFMRVVLFHAPINWFLTYPLFFGWLQPWMLALGAFFLSWIWTEPSTALWLMGVALTLYALELLGVFFAWRRRLYPSFYQKMLGVLHTTLLFVPKTIWWLISHFFTTRVLRIPLWGYALILVALKTTADGNTELGYHLMWLSAILVFAGIMVAWFGWCADKTEKNYQRRRAQGFAVRVVVAPVRASTPKPVARPKGMSSWQMLWGYVVGWKNRLFCPLVKLPDNQNEG